MLVGFGVVGSSLARIFVEQKELLRRAYGLNPNVVAILNSKGALSDPAGLGLEQALRARENPRGLASIEKLWKEGVRAPELLEELDCDVMIEVAPTNLTTGQPGLDYMRAAMKNGVHIVTSNKGPLAIAMPALLELAEHNEVILKFSGTVGGGTPMLDFAKNCLEGVKIESIKGILNGTTNYMLSKMDAEGASMEVALKEAKERGYAEADPTYDIDGIDAAGKLVIIANWVMGKSLSIGDIKIKGIRDITEQDIAEAKAEGNTIKLLALCNEKTEVAPTVIPRDHPLNVNHTINAVTFSTDLAGEITLVGRGAGGIETASAALRDLIGIRRSYAGSISGNMGLRRT